MKMKWRKSMKKNTILTTAIGTAAGVLGGIAVEKSKKQKEIEQWKKLSDKHLTLFMLMNQWVKISQKGKCIGDYFEENDYKKVAIYGMSYVGERLVDELAGSCIEVEYVIDQRADTIYSDVDIYLPDDILPKVDVIIVSAIYYFEDIYNVLVNRVECPIISLEDVLNELDD